MQLSAECAAHGRWAVGCATLPVRKACRRAASATAAPRGDRAPAAAAAAAVGVLAASGLPNPAWQLLQKCLPTPGRSLQRRGRAHGMATSSCTRHRSAPPFPTARNLHTHYAYTQSGATIADRQLAVGGCGGIRDSHLPYRARHAVCAHTPHPSHSTMSAGSKAGQGRKASRRGHAGGAP